MSSSSDLVNDLKNAAYSFAGKRRGYKIALSDMDRCKPFSVGYESDQALDLGPVHLPFPVCVVQLPSGSVFHLSDRGLATIDEEEDARNQFLRRVVALTRKDRRGDWVLNHTDMSTYIEEDMDELFNHSAEFRQVVSVLQRLTDGWSDQDFDFVKKHHQTPKGKPGVRERVITLGSRSIVRSVGDALSNDVRPLHQVRGHFVNYSPERPLFGKYVGRYWRASHSRGSDSNGVVHSTYTIKESA